MEKKKYSKLLLVLLLVAAGILIAYYLLHKNGNKTTIISFTKGTDIVEYGDLSVDSRSFVEEVDGTLIGWTDLDTKKLGEQELIYTIEKAGKKISAKFVVCVIDTQKPDIILKKDRIAVDYGETYDIQKNIVSVSDPVDGPLEYSKQEHIQNGSYMIEGTLDTKKLGNQKIRIIARDRNGNEARRSFTVNVAKRETLDAAALKGSQG